MNTKNDQAIQSETIATRLEILENTAARLHDRCAELERFIGNLAFELAELLRRSRNSALLKLAKAERERDEARAELERYKSSAAVDLARARADERRLNNRTFRGNYRSERNFDIFRGVLDGESIVTAAARCGMSPVGVRQVLDRMIFDMIVDDDTTVGGLRQKKDIWQKRLREYMATLNADEK